VIRRISRRLRSEDAGLSLAELLVSALMSLLILAMIGTFFIQTAKLTANSTQTTNSSNDAANIANEITSVIRVATTIPKSGAPTPDAAIVTGKKDSLVIYSLSNTDPATLAPVKVTFEIADPKGDGSRTLKETRCVATSSAGFWNFGGCTPKVRYLGNNLMPITGASDQLFTYLNATGGVIPFDAATGKIADANLSKVASIVVLVSVRSNGSRTQQVVISNKVVLGNLGLESSS
jgi:Tfp pilus assembly protein PilW